ncbi:MAG: hypothetical protein LC672_05110 [Acidobacteria bacterium]|nr:hypothetical protein [Acidobacteriota bacterium]
MRQQDSAPDHLLQLVQQVRSHYTELPTKSKPGRPRTYSGLSFLLLAVVAVTLRTFKGLELRRLVDMDTSLRQALGFRRVPHRRTIERRIAGLQAEAEAQVAALGQEIVETFSAADKPPPAGSIDGRMYEARGPKWHQKQRKQGIIPRGLRDVDTESAWSKSSYRGWVQGYRLMLQCLLWPVPVPLFATWQPNNVGEGNIFAQALDKEQLPVVPSLLGDQSFGTPELSAAYAAKGGWLLTPKQLPACYKTWKHDLYAMRKETVELLFQRIMQAFDLRSCPTKSLRRNGAFVITAVWLYQVICWSNYQQGKPIAEVKETIDLARWRIAA